MPTLTDDQLATLQIVVTISSALSMVSTAAVSASALVHRQYHSLPLRLLFMLLLCNFGLAACVFVLAVVPVAEFSNPQYSILCTVSGRWNEWHAHMSARGLKTRCVCLCVRTCVHPYVHPCRRLYVRPCIRLYVRPCVYIHMCVHVCVKNMRPMCTSVCIHPCIRLCGYLCLCVGMLVIAPS
jgi:hypothetical protein